MIFKIIKISISINEIELLNEQKLNWIWELSQKYPTSAYIFVLGHSIVENRYSVFRVLGDLKSILTKWYDPIAVQSAMVCSYVSVENSERRISQWLNEQKICIKFCQKLGHTCFKIIGMICQVYDNDSINDAQIKERFRQFKDSRVSMNSDPCFKIFNIEIVENVEHVLNVWFAINKNCRLTARVRRRSWDLKNYCFSNIEWRFENELLIENSMSAYGRSKEFSSWNCLRYFGIHH